MLVSEVGDRSFYKAPGPRASEWARTAALSCSLDSDCRHGGQGAATLPACLLSNDRLRLCAGGPLGLWGAVTVT